MNPKPCPIFRKAREFVTKYGFDGLDLDYEFPEVEDKTNFALWVKDISEEFKPFGLEVRKCRIQIKYTNFNLILS